MMLDGLPEPPVQALRWTGGPLDGTLDILDQTLLPGSEVWNARETTQAVVDDIVRLAVRGAPALGVAGAYGLVLAARESGPYDDRYVSRLEGLAARLASARPTAVNLARAVESSMTRARVEGVLERGPAFAAPFLHAFALALETYEREACARIGRAGADWLRGRHRILTHCNAGALVTPGLGTALAPIYVLHAEGESVHVWVDETRPLLQGLRLTAFELARAGVPHRVLVEGAAPGLMRRGDVDAVIVGADRVCLNGDVANKIGTYALAVAAHRHGVPFLVAAPLSTLDPHTASGDAVDIEERPEDGLRYLLPGTALMGLEAYAPAFDVTPAELITALVTDHGIVEAGDAEGRAALMEAAARLQPRTRPGR